MGERICKEFFEQIFQLPFPKSRPKWLINDLGNRMELDGFCRECRIAFEHHGEQHYSLKTMFIKNDKDLTRRKKNDKLRRELCRKKGVVLIEVPEIPSRLPISEVKNFLKQAFLKKGIELPIDFDSQEIDLKNAYTTSSARQVMSKLQLIAPERREIPIHQL